MTSTASGQCRSTVQVVPLLRLHHLGNRRFDYLVPDGLEGTVGPGSVVYVPFGRRTVRAVVVGEGGSNDRPSSELRPLDSVEPETIPSDLFRLAETVAHRYLASYESCLRLVTPPSRGRKRSNSGRASRDRWVESAISCEALDLQVRLTKKQQLLVGCVPPGGAPLAGLCERAGVGRGVLRTLLDKGVLVLRDPPLAGALTTDPAATPTGSSCFADGGVKTVPPELWPEQQQAVDRLLQDFAADGLSERLLWGVTGSGKTEVYLCLIARAVEQGWGAILLVPEIALTPQMIGRVKERFGGRVAPLHSGLTKKERAQEYARIASGRAQVVVGARSAVFAPVPRLRLIIVDEAHETSYKQDEEPRYHAVTVARLRLAESGGLLLKGTATPSVESMCTPEGRLRLSRRAVGQEPACEVVDMRRQGPGLLLAPYSREALAATMRCDEQAIVLLNRRGYAGYVHCDACGHALMCSDCELSLTYHSRIHRLVCHHCGRTYEQPTRCPACGEGPLTRGTPGTERLAQELKALVPREQVFRMDSDVLGGGRQVSAILEAFSEARPAVLLGTQMVAKGHDFPDVTLVLVADADTGLYIPDFRAAERTFQLLRQVAGRTGRAGRPGRVVVQTWNPDVPCIKMALERDEQRFYDEELATRSRLRYPPFSQIVRLVMSASDPERAQAAARFLADRLAPYFGAHEVWGPSRLPALRGRTRWHILVVAVDGVRMRAIVGQAVTQLTEPYRRRGVRLLVDVDPLSFT
ncbi:MAG: replication restart helicase PriA [Thermoleophilia bacterium]|jgi:primosomal protein N' (replication factor Y)